MKSFVYNQYAGDDAWRAWFRICSVAGCEAETAQRLSAQINRAMLAQLNRYGFTVDDISDDDPVSFFDSYFKLKGSREKGKPLKLYFAHRIAAQGISMLNFVCGTLFGSGSGRIHDIVLDWIATLKGWRPHSLRDAEGKRHIVWENAGDETIAEIELSEENDPASLVEAEGHARLARRLLKRISSKIKVEKSKVALLLYATAQNVSITDATVLEGLETEKSRAYALREKTMNVLKRELMAYEVAGDPLFVRMLLETCEANLPECVRAQEEGAVA